MVHQILGRAYRMVMRRSIVGRNITTLVDPPRHREPEMSPLSTSTSTASRSGSSSCGAQPYRHGCAQPAACAEGRHRDRCGSGCSAHARYCPQRAGGEWGPQEPKGGKARTIVLPAPLDDQLAEHRTAQEAARAAGGRDARLHVARHTAATLVEQGVDIRVVQEILGHSTLPVTKRYTHVTNTLARQAAERMGRALWD